jgi:hypothetical protein
VIKISVQLSITLYNFRYLTTGEMTPKLNVIVINVIKLVLFPTKEKTCLQKCYETFALLSLLDEATMTFLFRGLIKNLVLHEEICLSPSIHNNFCGVPIRRPLN